MRFGCSTYTKLQGEGSLSICIWVHMFVQTQVHICRQQGSTQDICLNCSPPYFGVQVLLLNLEFTH